MGDHRHRVGVDEVEQIKAAEGEDQAAQHGGVAALEETAEEKPGAEEQKGIGAEAFPGQGGPQRQAAIQKLVPGMIRAPLPFACQVETGIELRHPIEGFAAGQAFCEERPDGHVVGAEVVAGINAAGEERTGQGDQQQHSHQPGPGGQVLVEGPGGRFGGRFGFMTHGKTTFQGHWS